MTRSHEEKCANCEALGRHRTDVVFGLSAIVLAIEAAVARGETEMGPPLREAIAGMGARRLASLVVWAEEESGRYAAVDDAKAALVERVLHALHTELELRASLDNVEADSQGRATGDAAT